MCKVADAIGRAGFVVLKHGPLTVASERIGGEWLFTFLVGMQH